ncbi:MAG: hypothetical protein EXR21_00540 [Flavobacteriaceae bacterium]|nr:hypothetical protein [Flavobacteriaceae bacterium]
MQKILYTICITSCLSTSTAQEKSAVFHLKDYKYRYQKYHGLGFDIVTEWFFKSTNQNQGLSQRTDAWVDMARWISPRYQVHCGMDINTRFFSDFQPGSVAGFSLSQRLDAGFIYFLPIQSPCYSCLPHPLTK